MKQTNANGPPQSEELEEELVKSEEWRQRNRKAAVALHEVILSTYDVLESARQAVRSSRELLDSLYKSRAKSRVARKPAAA